MELLEPILISMDYRLCDHCFSTMYIWQHKYATKICIEDGIVYVAFSYGTSEMSYMAPINAGDKLSCAMMRIIDDACERGIEFKATVINDVYRKELESVMPNKFDYRDDRDNSDYIYLSQSMIDLKGKKLHSKRNFINRFMSDYMGRYEFEEISEKNYFDVLEFNGYWCRSTRIERNLPEDTDTCIGNEESCAIATALNNMNSLKMVGVCMRLDGRVVAYAMGTRLNHDTFLEQIEKADAEIPGAYPMITREFAARFAGSYRYLNREEDMGIEGLRRAKLSFAPEFINLRYTAILRR